MSDDFAIEKTVTITGYQRPELFDDALKHLAACGFDGWHLFARIEPSPKQAEFEKVCAKYFSPKQFSIHLNEEKLGVCINPFQNIEDAFAAGSQFNLNIEEDVNIASDTLGLCEWYIANKKSNWFCLNLLSGPCGVESYISRPELPNALVESKAFNSLGFGMDSTMWQNFGRLIWEAEFIKTESKFRQYGLLSWDWALYKYLYFSDLYSVQPLCARGTHTGVIGTHSQADFHNRAFGRLPLNTSHQDDFKILSGDDVPQDIAAHIRAHDQIGTQFFTPMKKKNRKPFLQRLSNSVKKRISKAY